MKRAEIRVAHIYGTMHSEQELLDNLAAVVSTDSGKKEEVVVFLDHLTPWYPDGAIIVLPAGQVAHLCVVDDWPEAPLARPYVHLASAFAAGRDALLAGATPMDAADAAMYRWHCITGDSIEKNRQLREDLIADMAGWAFILREEASAA